MLDVSPAEVIDALTPEAEALPDEPSEPAFTLAELADREAARHRATGTPVALMFARHMDELALKIRIVGARTPAEYEARAELLEAEIRDRYEAIGYEAGKAACPRCAAFE